MKKFSGFIILILIGTVLVAAATQRPNKKYRHVRTNKKAWAKLDATSDTLSIDEGALEVWVSSDSILICTEVTYNDVEVGITDQLHDYAVINNYSFEQLTPERDERIDISGWDDGIYMIRIYMKYTPEVCMYGYFAKGVQYEAEAETLNDEITSVTTVVEDRTGLLDNTIYDLQGQRVAPQHLIEGHIYIQNGRKFRK
ncbi:MAG: hypothetical protein IJV05_03235 [Muribaculaceae bacterium]|nr:hypothetical protein [Muribaculaceae bacterium]